MTSARVIFGGWPFQMLGKGRSEGPHGLLRVPRAPSGQMQLGPGRNQRIEALIARLRARSASSRSSLASPLGGGVEAPCNSRLGERASGRSGLPDRVIAPHTPIGSRRFRDASHDQTTER